MKDDSMALVLKNDWVVSFPDHIYRGKYTVGIFHLTEMFIIEYMKLIHEVEISDSWVSSNFTNIPDINLRKIMYMEGCDILSKNTIKEIRNAVKSPPNNTKIYRNGIHITNIKIIEERNEIIL